MSYYMDNGGGNDFGPENTPQKKNTALIIVLIIFGCLSLFCCLPFIAPALEIVTSFKTDFVDELKKYDTPVEADVIDVFRITEVNSQKLAPEEKGFFFTYEYEYNGQKYQSSFTHSLDKHYRYTGDKVQLLINSDVPTDIYDPECFTSPDHANYILGHEPEYFNVSVDAAVVDVREVRQGDWDERKGDDSGFGFTCQYEYNGRSYQSDYPELFKAQFYNIGDKVDIKIKSSSPNEFYAPDTIKATHKIASVMLAIGIVVLLVPAIAIIAAILLVLRSARGKKDQVKYHYDSQDYYDPNDDYRG